MTTNSGASAQPQSLSGVRVLDLSRVLAGPWCTQTLADLGADVIKVERPGQGDDTRGWGPPFLRDRAGHDTAEAAYYLGTNRNKRSIGIDIAGMPARFAVAVKMSLRYISYGSEIDPIGNAGVGVVGVKSTSTPLENAFVKSRVISDRTA